MKKITIGKSTFPKLTEFWKWPIALGGFSKTSAFGKSTLDLKEKLSFWTVFPKPFPKLTEFWKWPIALLLAALTFPAFSGDWEISGEAKTGFLWEKTEKVGKDPEEKVRLGSLDDAGDDQGRFRLNLEYTEGNVGFKIRIEYDKWAEGGPSKWPWSYAFGYVNSFEDQLTFSIGKLGSSPWGTGGPEKWKELEVMDKGGGVRVEYKPYYLPGLNVGFVLNWFNGSSDRGYSRNPTILDLLQESVLGVSYVNDYFLFRFAYRLDNELDQRPGSGIVVPREGDDLIYRIEEKVLNNYLKGLKIWALGVYEGVGSEDDSCIHFENWLFTEFAPEWFTAQIRFGYDVIATRSVVHLKPSYYHHFFDRFLTLGASFLWAQDFGDSKVYPGSPYWKMELEPKVQLNFQNAYIAFVYIMNREYIHETPLADPPINQTQRMNLRFGMWF
ncbi:MAG: hypothetical protein LBB72_07875 [Spirochaetaceae bacterium]|nr:hypothetical protein [Spirochaetaceae bacterium]